MQPPVGPMGTSLLGIFLLATAIKLLLMPGYKSTDFEVHRNWLAITHSLPLDKWYYEATSEWTLDYPPAFAYFEYLLSHAAPLFDKAILQISATPFESPNTVLFQRLSVMATDVTLLFGLRHYFSRPSVERKTRVAIGVLVLLNAGLLIIDHIHFQYNGMLFGLLLITLAHFKHEDFHLGAITFALLLNFKHLFLVMAPAIFVFLLSRYCCENGRFRSVRFLSLGISVIGVFSVLLGPFFQHLPQLLSRLFPFKRGLVHAYWAPNFWALYTFVDIALRQCGLGSQGARVATRGLVGDIEFAVLPEIRPIHTMMLTLLMQLPALYRLWRWPTQTNLIRSTVLCSFAAYLFGWHVHEKAMLNMVIPLSLIALESKLMSRIYFVLTLVGIYSLFPLVFEVGDITIRWALLITYSAISWRVLASHHRCLSLSLPIRFYIAGLLFVEWFTVFGHPLLLGQETLPFLPLMLTSFYCAIGMCACFIALYCT